MVISGRPEKVKEKKASRASPASGICDSRFETRLLEPEKWKVKGEKESSESIFFGKFRSFLLSEEILKFFKSVPAIGGSISFIDFKNFVFLQNIPILLYKNSIFFFWGSAKFSRLFPRFPNRFSIDFLVNFGVYH